jgi:hypothetical protein
MPGPRRNNGLCATCCAGDVLAMKSKDMMSRLRLMCMFAMTAYAIGDADAQSFIVAPNDPLDLVVVAGRPYRMTVTRDTGAGTDTSYSGPQNLKGWYTWDSPVGAPPVGPKDPQICAPNVGGNCLPATGACQVVTSSSSGTSLPPLTFNAGIATFCLVAPDVGKFSVSVNDGSVLAVASPTLTARPDHFDLDLSGVALKNRSELNCPAPGSAFTYMGEPIGVTFTLTAMNQAGGKTDNYVDSFVHFTNVITDPSTWTTLGANNMGLWMVATGYPVGTDTCKAMFSNTTPSVTSFACSDPANNPASINRGAGPRVVISSAMGLEPTMSWTSGVGTFTVNVVLERADVPDGPYDSVKIGIAPKDADGVTVPTSNLDADNNSVNERIGLGAQKLRYGRLSIANAYGSELLPLPIEVQAQYWNGTSYVSNNDDGCTPLAALNFSTAQAQGAAINTGVAATGTLNGTTGKGKIALTKPSPTPAGKGAVDVKSEIPYLPGKGRATFGVYKSGPVIYRRELHY